MLLHHHDHNRCTQRLVLLLIKYGLSPIARRIFQAYSQRGSHNLAQLCTCLAAQHKESPWLHFMMIRSMRCGFQDMFDLLTIWTLPAYLANTASPFDCLEYIHMLFYLSLP